MDDGEREKDRARKEIRKFVSNLVGLKEEEEETE